MNPAPPVMIACRMEKDAESTSPASSDLPLSQAAPSPLGLGAPRMRTGEPVLIISYTFPPYKGIGGRRWAKFARTLAERGHPVHVIHSAGSDDLKGSLWNDDVVHPNIHTHPLPQRYPTVLFKRPLTTFTEKVMYRAWQRALPLITTGNWLDKAVRWRKPLLALCERLIAAHGIRNIIVTGAPFSLMAHVCALRQRHPELNLVADFRDPWTWGHYYGQKLLSATDQEHEQAQEALVARTFNKLISPAPDIVAHLKDTYGGVDGKYVLIPHAIDPAEMGSPAPRPNDGTFRMMYAGSLYGAEEAEAYFEEVLKAFEDLRTQDPARFARSVFDLYITGHGTDAYRAKVKARGLEAQIRFHAPLPAREIFPRLAAADLVIIFIPSPNKDFLGTKFNEIFYLRRPVLHVGVEGRVGRTIAERRLGASIRVEEVAVELPRIIRGERRITIDPNVDLSEHLLGSITDKLVRDVLV
jgi:glycosyltransferase involved in cell wall biosynthesis